MKKIYKFLIVVAICLFAQACSNNQATKNVIKEVTLNQDGNIVIKADEITDIATFYTYEVNGIVIEFFAVRASDGTIRTAFNTCQVCNPSSKAFFIQEGKYFICQNCGNKFSIDRIGIEMGGCNPIPILDKDKIIDGENIIIDKDYIASYESKFENLEIKH